MPSASGAASPAAFESQHLALLGLASGSVAPSNGRFVPWDTHVSQLQKGVSLYFVRSRASRLCRFEGRMADLDIDTISCVTVLHKDFGTDSETVSAASDVGVSVGPAGDEH